MWLNPYKNGDLGDALLLFYQHYILGNVKFSVSTLLSFYQHYPTLLCKSNIYLPSGKLIVCY